MFGNPRPTVPTVPTVHNASFVLVVSALSRWDTGTLESGVFLNNNVISGKLTKRIPLISQYTITHLRGCGLLQEYNFSFRISVVRGDIQYSVIPSRILIAILGLNIDVGTTNLIEVRIYSCHLDIISLCI